MSIQENNCKENIKEMKADIVRDIKDDVDLLKFTSRRIEEKHIIEANEIQERINKSLDILLGKV